MNNKLISEPKELVSDSLKNVLSDDELTEAYQSSFITIAFYDDASDPLIGSLIGIETVKNMYKSDLRVSMNQAFDFISDVFKKKITRIQFVALSFSNKVTKLTGPFEINCVKIIDLDATKKMCIIAIDLIKA